MLGLREAVELGHAWVQAIAADRGIRVLFLKGPALQQQGLRAGHVSSDVDVLVEPARFAELCAAVRDRGWIERPVIFFDRIRTLHSATLIRTGWPCDLDVHEFYPGFLADPVEVFEALWARREQRELAHRACDVPDRAGGVLILALHSLRGGTANPRHGAELAHLLSVPLTAQERADVAALALATGSTATLSSVLPGLGVHVEPPASQLRSPELREWRRRVDSGSTGTYFWLAALRHARWRARPAILWHAAWPTRRDLLIARPATRDTVAGRLRSRFARATRGVRVLPAALSALVANRRR